MTQYRLAHYLAMCGVASRKNSSKLITEGRVKIDGRLANHTDKVDDAQVPDIYVDDIAVDKPEAKQYWIYHKPVGIDCNLDAQRQASLIHHLPEDVRLFSVGRLDKDSRGLLLLTNDGQFNQQLMHPEFHYPKTYHVTVEHEFDAEFIHKMATGVSYKDVTTKPCKVSAIGEIGSTRQFEICLTQGMNRQIRRMAKALGYYVCDLQRVAIGELIFADVNEGEMRQLTNDELASLRSLTKAD
ncbi:pseudouridine synthase [Shewanella sp. WXL01]|uniref:pseudouridine synthase n=1 Tax=Shewanella sp. WXL01 TaxID=2709721 RepID=UPI0014386039|nr:pseudouridine synthase [Shewanella sp. WXL01]NKF49312.1 pseudouridine synthase [Shewanella sp. WXL01]